VLFTFLLFPLSLAFIISYEDFVSLCLNEPARNGKVLRCYWAGDVPKGIAERLQLPPSTRAADEAGARPAGDGGGGGGGGGHVPDDEDVGDAGDTHGVLGRRDIGAAVPAADPLLDATSRFRPTAEVKAIRAWLSSGGVSAQTHYDVFHNALIQLVGSKRVTLVPPDRHLDMKLHPSLHPG